MCILTGQVYFCMGNNIEILWAVSDISVAVFACLNGTEL